MADPQLLREAAMQLATGAIMPARELAERLARARRPEYWQSLSPHLRIGANQPLPCLEVDAEREATAARLFEAEGYFETPELLPPDALAALNQCIDLVTAAGWPAIFALVDDRFWQCARLPALRRLVAARLGEGYQQIPHVWIHIVQAVDGAAGWMPHFDGFALKRVSVWLALTRATTENGCMYLVPSSVLPDSFRIKDATPDVPMRDVVRAMHATRAMPVEAGAALGWEFHVFHWGGRAVNPRSQRRALSMEFLAASEQPGPDERPLLDPDGALPDLAYRLKAIGLALDTYSKREPLSLRFRSLGQRLME